MTGFARTDGSHEGYSWTWEIKSVNSRNLDLRFRVPPGHDEIEMRGRKAAQDRFARGNLSIGLTLRRPDRPPIVTINQDVLGQLRSAAAAADPDGTAPRIETLMALPGVVETSHEDETEDERGARFAAILASLDESFGHLAEARQTEGEALRTVLDGHIVEIEKLTTAARGLAETQPAKLQSKLKSQLEELLGDSDKVDGDRLAQEVAQLVVKADIREEMDRLDSHIQAARDLLAADGAVGRKLDFLCQEFNREANTLCSKASETELTRIGLDLKAAIDRMREQVQNIE